MMKLNKLLIVDFEATCWEEDTPKQESEIIEIGLCQVIMRDKNHLSPIFLGNSPRIIVKPTINPQLSDYCTRLTGITQEMVDNGANITDVCQEIYDKYRNWVWASWGEYDRKLIEDTVKRTSCVSPFSKNYFNLKIWYSAVTGYPSCRVWEACRKLNIVPYGRDHNGSDDAFNEGAIFTKLSTITRNLFAGLEYND